MLLGCAKLGAIRRGSCEVAGLIVFKVKVFCHGERCVPVSSLLSRSSMCGKALGESQKRSCFSVSVSLFLAVCLSQDCVSRQNCGERLVERLFDPKGRHLHSVLTPGGESIRARKRQVACKLASKHGLGE